MATELLPIGTPFTMVQNRIYATPARKHMIHAQAAVEISDTVAFAASDVLTNADTVGAENAAPFIRCTTANCIVTCKPL